MEKSLKETRAVNTTVQNPLGTKPVSKLVFSMAVPAVIANLANALYNIVDQIFIGQGVGYLGNAATSVAFPLTTICMALGLMAGLGSAASFNLALGKGEEKKAKQYAGTAVAMLFITGVMICILVQLFLEPLMNTFGATEQTLSYAMAYSRISAFGIPFLLISTGINPLVRADRSATYSMIGVVSGAILNTILDPLFIFTFDMGIAGAALATVISQILSAVILLAYFPRFKSVKIEKNDFIPRGYAIKSITTLGLTPFIFQISTMIIQITLNNLLKIYGAESVYGSDIPIAVAGIISKINVIFTSIVLGVVQGSQPVCSFNYGAGNYRRVRETLKLWIVTVFSISLVIFAIFMIFPRPIFELFGEGTELYFEFAVKYLRVFLFFVYLNGIQVAATTFFPTIGKAGKGVFLSLSKNIMLQLSLLFLLSHFFGLDGIMFSYPITDFIACAIAVIMVWLEMRCMGSDPRDKTNLG